MIAAPSPQPPLQLLVFPTVAFAVAAMLAVVPDAIPLSVQILGLLAVVVVLGVPHGALDPWIAASAGLVPTRRRLVAFNLIYVALALAVVAIWSLVPAFALLCFLMISAWHFSGDWASSWGAAMRVPLRILSGGLLLLLPIGFHPGEVAETFVLLSGEAGGELARWLTTPIPVMVTGVLAVIAEALWRRQCWTAVQFAPLLVLSVSAPPLVYFAIYFCVFHSPTHLINSFQMAGPALRGRLLRMILIYSLGSLAIGLPMVWLWSDAGTDSLLARLIFIGLAALTVPHMTLLEIASRRESTRRIERAEVAPGHFTASLIDGEST